MLALKNPQPRLVVSGCSKVAVERQRDAQFSSLDYLDRNLLILRRPSIPVDFDPTTSLLRGLQIRS